MIIVEQGKIVEFCSESGEFVYDTSTEPSIFYGDLGESVKRSFETLGQRFTFGGEPGKDQRVYFFNKKEIPGNIIRYANTYSLPSNRPQYWFRYRYIHSLPWRIFV